MAKPGTTVLGVALGLLLTSFIAPLPSRAATTIDVTRRDDPQPNGCHPADCSLREAIIAANAAPWSTIQLDARIYTLTIRGSDLTAPNPAIGDLDVMVPMTITGAGSKTTFVQFGPQAGQGLARIFDVYSQRLVKITGVTIRFGRDVDGGSGGCIKNTGTLTLDAVVVSGCSSPIRGGAISSYTDLVIRGSVISNNSVSASSTTGDTGGGGGIAGGNGPNGRGSIVVADSRIDNNRATNIAGSIAYGGGFSNVGDMTILDSTVSGNFADSSAGGISNASGKMSIVRSTFSGNMATRDAGGLDNDGDMAVVASTFSDNQAGFQCTGADCKQAFAGGLLSTKTATTTVDNSTFTGNSCGRNGSGMSGGGLLGNASLRIRSSTIVDNSCPLGAGVTSSPNGDTHLMDTIVAGNHFGADGGDCSGQVTFEGYNLFGSTRGCRVAGDTATIVFTRDPQVGLLKDNGGATETMALQPGSPAVNAGRPGGCLNTSGQPLTQDQRGLPRPADGRCDIGAFEL